MNAFFYENMISSRSCPLGLAGTLASATTQVITGNPVITAAVAIAMSGISTYCFKINDPVRLQAYKNKMLDAVCKQFQLIEYVFWDYEREAVLHSKALDDAAKTAFYYSLDDPAIEKMAEKFLLKCFNINFIWSALAERKAPRINKPFFPDEEKKEIEKNKNISIYHDWVKSIEHLIGNTQ